MLVERNAVRRDAGAAELTEAVLASSSTTSEACYLADRVFEMEHGVMVELAEPPEIAELS